MAEHITGEGIEILRVLCGSRAYGLEGPDSDYDYHGVYVVPTRRLLAIGPKIKETSWIEGEETDNTAWEIGHFLKLAVHCNPTVLETFVAPVVYVNSPVGYELRELLPHVLSRKRVYEAFRGYASNQRKKMFEPPGGVRAPDRMGKAATAYLRSLYHGTWLLTNGTYGTLIADAELRERLQSLKTEVPLDLAEVVRLAVQLEAKLTTAYVSTDLPLEPNMDAVNEFLLDVRKRFWVED